MKLSAPYRLMQNWFAKERSVPGTEFHSCIVTGKATPNYVIEKKSAIRFKVWELPSIIFFSEIEMTTVAKARYGLNDGVAGT